MSFRVSVIIPVYNSEKTLRKCVESLVCGDEKHMEIILVDDCSRDNSWKLCQELQAQFSNVKCIQNQKNSGVSYTRNHGLYEANSEWIMFVDSDDWVSHKFISRILKVAQENIDSLVLCGFYYIDKLNYKKNTYIWDDESAENIFQIQGDQLFEAVQRIMIQNVWNKIFSYEIIREKGIKFDETQNMGEDFQFVLEYMQAANLNKCTIINEALYYYVRGNDESLMSNFGWSSSIKEIERLKFFATLCGNSKVINKKLEKAIDMAKASRVYYIVRSKNKSKKEKLNQILEIYHKDERYYYRKQDLIRKKEKLIKNIIWIKQVFKRIKGKVKYIKNQRLIKQEKGFLKKEKFSIISQNCIGGVFYHDMEKQFLSPTVNLYFEQPDFIRFVLNLEKYLAMPITVSWEEEYPVGTLEDVKIHFMHYECCTEAEASWYRRRQRVDLNKILVLSTDMEGFDDEAFEQWNKIEYPKILFTAHDKYKRGKESVFYPKYKKFNHVLDLIPAREFYKNDVLIDLVNKI